MERIHLLLSSNTLAYAPVKRSISPLFESSLGMVGANFFFLLNKENGKRVEIGTLDFLHSLWDDLLLVHFSLA